MLDFRQSIDRESEGLEVEKSWTQTNIYLHFCLFFAMWIAARLCIALIENQIPIGLTTDLMEVAFKTAIMVGLAVIWLNRNQRGLWLENRKLYQFKFPVVFWLLLALFIGYLGIDMWVKFHGFHFHSNVINSGQFFGSTICAGVTEELLFRGFFMNSLLKHYSFWPANIIQVILFQLSHVPLYLIEGLSLMGWFSNVLTVVPLGLIFGWIFYRSKSLWPSTILHCVWDAGILLFLS